MDIYQNKVRERFPIGRHYNCLYTLCLTVTNLSTRLAAWQMFTVDLITTQKRRVARRTVIIRKKQSAQMKRLLANRYHTCADL